jgi:prepilin-type N-terminal cleavage/methylation domain-containing protein
MANAGDAFTLVEMLVSVAVLTVLVLIVTKMVDSATIITNTSGRHMDTDSQARTVLDRLAVDFGRMLRRSDVDYFIKQPDATKYPGKSGEHGHKKGTKGNDASDQIAFYSEVPGYYPSSGSQSPISLVAYRVNATSYKLERMGKGLLWNGVTTGTAPKGTRPLLFLPQTIAGTLPWSGATVNDGSNDSKDDDYETIGPQVFRFEYYYLLKNGDLTDTPWDTTATPPHTKVDGLKDIEAIVVAIAVVDSRSRSVLTDQDIADLATQMNDFKTQNGNGPVKTGVLEEQWQKVITDNVKTGEIPPAAVQAIRIYSHYFNLNLH